jgi:hypothetical protein
MEAVRRLRAGTWKNGSSAPRGGLREVRRYTGLMRHWFCAVAMYFLNCGGKNVRTLDRWQAANAGAEGVEQTDRTIGVLPM